MNRVTLSALIALLITACSEEPMPPPAPVGDRTPPTLPTPPDVPDPLCPWDGLCESLLTCDGECGPDRCDLPCRDGVRCVDLEVEGGILCDIEGSTGNTSTGPESATETE